MRYLAAVLAALLAVSCGGDATAPEGPPDSIEIIGGNFQLDTVAHQLEDSLAVIVTSGGLPVSDLTVCWVAVTEGAGEPFVPCQETDSEGHAETMWTLGTVAGEHTAEARAMLNDTPTVAAVYELEAVPGPAAQGEWLQDCTGQGTVEDTLEFSINWSIEDEFGNAIPWTLRSFEASSLYTIEADSQTIATAPDGSGVDSMEVVTDGGVVRLAHVYVRHPDVDANLLMWNWNDTRDCENTSAPAP